MAQEENTTIERWPFDLPKPGSSYNLDRAGLHLEIPGSVEVLTLPLRQLRRLEKGKRLGGVPGFQYYDHCGFSFRSYAEFFITAGKSVNWEADTLQFKIGNVEISVDSASEIIPLLFKPYYRNKDHYQTEFQTYATLKMYGADTKDHQSLLHKAIYYLNAEYLRPIDLAAALYHLIPPSEPFYYPMFDKVVSSRIIKKRNLRSIEPLIMFNLASEQYEGNRFLGYYRVLEYFFYRSLAMAVGEMRRDNRFTDQEIVNLTRKSDELASLRKLTNACTSSSKKRTLSDYAFKKGLIKTRTFDDLTKTLYDYRCGLVHAKEEQITSAVVPDPFKPNRQIEDWNVIVQELAIRAIKKYNAMK